MLVEMAVTATTGSGARYRDELRVPEFRALFAAFALSLTGSVVSAVALMVLVYERTGSSLLASLTFALGFLPYLVSGALLSAVVDRVPLRRLLAGCDLACAALVAAMALPGVPVPGAAGLLVAVGTVARVFRVAARRAPAERSSRAGVRTGPIAVPDRRPECTDRRQCHRRRAADRAFAPRRDPDRRRLVPRLCCSSPGGSSRYHERVLDPVERPACSATHFRAFATVFAHRPLRRLCCSAGSCRRSPWPPRRSRAPYVADLGGPVALVGWWLVAIPLGVVVGDLVGIWALLAADAAPARRAAGRRRSSPRCSSSSPTPGFAGRLAAPGAVRAGGRLRPRLRRVVPPRGA